MEYLATFDQLNQPLFQNLSRREVHKIGYWHRTVQIYVLHPEKGYLCHRRSSSKDLFPSLWDISIGGHLGPEETYLDCAVRELSEELGIAVQPEKLEFVKVVTIDGKDEKAGLLDREHAGIFLYHTSLNAEDFTVQQEEVEEVEYLSMPKLRADLQSTSPSRNYIPLQEHFLHILSLLEEHQNRAG
ncbi:NUDIX hydrolase [Rufibacter tibetensis]|uniref:NUDIX hydrolase n=1 Tax=Rufibacter tibetensis TaxID=512763 RepID=UPI0007859C50|nr:NUDIX domain-containing protein [Rufibacter tibetensis]